MMGTVKSTGETEGLRIGRSVSPKSTVQTAA